MLRIMQENIEDFLKPNLWLALAAEFFGTLAITLLGCGVWIVTTNPEQIAFTFGLAVATVVWVFSHISGGYFNPAVTTTALLLRKISIIRGVLYIIIQLAGAIAGAGILFGLTRASHRNLGVNELSSSINSAQGFGFELLITFVYVLAVSASTDEKRTDLKGSAPLTIGLTVVACHFFAIPYTTAGMNPARSFGPALIVGFWKDHWVFWVGPLVGAVLGGILYEYVFAAGATFDCVKQCLLTARRPRKQAELEKAPLEEVKDEVIEIGEFKADGDKDGAGGEKDEAAAGKGRQKE